MAAENKSCFITGDFNINLLNYVHPSSQAFLDLIYSYSFLPLINKPTRITNTSATLIDNLFTNVLPSPKCGIILTDISDHLPIFKILQSFHFRTSLKNNSGFTNVRNLSNYNSQKLCDDLHSFDWSNVFDLNNPDLVFNNFMDNFNKACDKNIPFAKIKHRSKTKPNVPWINKTLLKSINKKNKLYCQYLAHPTDHCKMIYTRYKNTLISLLRLSKKHYFIRQFEMEKNNIRNTWKVINSVLNNKTTSHVIRNIIHEGRLIDNPIDIANIFNDYFVNIGPKLASNIIPDTSSSHTDYLMHPNPNSLFFVPVTESEVSDIVNGLHNKKSSGYDSVNISVVKNSISAICKPLTHAINLSLISGIVPHQLKTAKVIPVFKSGDSNCVCNYRPISILSCFSKIFEKCIYNRTVNFLDKFNVLSNSQFGFRTQHSTIHAILNLIDNISTAIDKSEHTLGIFLDLSKAFDTINYDIILSKLSHYGIRGISLEWFRSYLTNRSQYVSICGANSTMQKLTCGVPQGSILGPLLFIIYINDFIKSSDTFHFILFADDSNLFLSHSNLSTLVDVVNRELELVSKWFRVNKLSLNIKKTNCMLFSNRSKEIPHDVVIDDIVIKQTDCFKFLGLFIDSSMSWKYHVDYLCKKLARNIGVINRIKCFFPSSVLASLYNTLVVSYINYGILVWGNCSACYLNRLFLLQKRAIRTINVMDFYAHTDPLYVKVKALKIKDIYCHQLGSLMYQAFHSTLPFSIRSIFVQNTDIHSHYTRQATNYHIPSIRTSFAHKTIKFEGPKLWNSLGDSLKRSGNFSTFKNKYKSILLGKYII